MENDSTHEEPTTTEDGTTYEQRRSPERQSAMGQVMKRTPPGRSVSRGRSHVDNSIEATLANAEPVKNIRSRKSSHYMGVFREHTVPTEHSPRTPGIEEHGHALHPNQLSSSSVPPADQAPSSPHTAIVAESTNKIQPQEHHQLDLPTARKQPTSTTSSTRTSAPNSLPQSKPSSPLKHNHDPYFRKQDAMKRPKSSPRPPIPPNLLEQIREHHNLAPLRAQGSKQANTSTGNAPGTQSGFINRRSLLTGQTPAQEQEDEEHISSAVYFPHPGPSPEELEEIIIPNGEEQVAGEVAGKGVSTPVVVKTQHEFERPFSEAAAPEHIDISVQSKHEKSVFHGNYQPEHEDVDSSIDRPVLASIGEKFVESATSASESELESADDFEVSSQTEDQETTPTATPVPLSQVKRRKRTSASAAPKGAVVLEPYSHQVGGHSTIFRFSRRAVCKQLNNRENEFYERIERRHPDLLRFLPRLVNLH